MELIRYHLWCCVYSTCMWEDIMAWHCTSSSSQKTRTPSRMLYRLLTSAFLCPLKLPNGFAVLYIRRVRESEGRLVSGHKGPGEGRTFLASIGIKLKRVGGQRGLSQTGTRKANIGMKGGTYSIPYERLQR